MRILAIIVGTVVTFVDWLKSGEVMDDLLDMALIAVIVLCVTDMIMYTACGVWVMPWTRWVLEVGK